MANEHPLNDLTCQAVGMLNYVKLPIVWIVGYDPYPNQSVQHVSGDQQRSGT